MRNDTTVIKTTPAYCGREALVVFNWKNFQANLIGGSAGLAGVVQHESDGSIRK